MTAEVISLEDWREAKRMDAEARVSERYDGQSAGWFRVWADYYREKALTRLATGAAKMGCGPVQGGGDRAAIP